VRCEQWIQVLPCGSASGRRLGYTPVRPSGHALVVWLVAHAAGVGLLWLLTGYFISQIAEPTLKGVLAVVRRPSRETARTLLRPTPGTDLPLSLS
jgi:hypothetical protein